jgi:hypothetical protein
MSFTLTAHTKAAKRRAKLSRLRGALAEWLRSGLQSRLHRFDSGRRLSENRISKRFSEGRRGRATESVSRISTGARFT